MFGRVPSANRLSLRQTKASAIGREQAGWIEAGGGAITFDILR